MNNAKRAEIARLAVLEARANRAMQDYADELTRVRPTKTPEELDDMAVAYRLLEAEWLEAMRALNAAQHSE